MTDGGQLALIVCCAKGGVIGRNGSVPWQYPEDLACFKRVTMGHTLIVGRRTYESIGKPLTGRRLIVLSRNPAYSAPGCDVCHSFDEALARAYETDDCPFICGGGMVYARALPRATIIYLTQIKRELRGDTYFPDLDENEWQETRHEENGDLVFRILERNR
jgi:dihydrofolate reductase